MGKKRRTSKRAKAGTRIDWTGHLPESLSKDAKVIYTHVVRFGSSNEEIADKTGISVRNIRYHVSRLLCDLECRSREELISEFWRDVVTEPPPLPKYIDPDHPASEVFYLVLLGLENREISDELGVSHRNVRYFVSNMLRSARQPNRAKFIASFLRRHATGR